MKKSVYSFMAILFLTISITSLSTQAHAASMSIGPYVWYAAWNPIFERMMKTYYDATTLAQPKSSFKMEPMPLGGAVLSFTFNNRVSFSNVFAVGRYKANASSVSYIWNAIIQQPIWSFPKNSMPIMKYDLDSTLNINLTKIVKLFFGFKYQHYKYTLKCIMPVPAFGGASYRNDTTSIHGLSGGLGLGFTFHLVENLYLLWNFSGVYQYPLITYTGSGFLIFSTGLFIPTASSSKPIFNMIGANSTLSFAYVISKASSTITFGFRYQYNYLIGKDIKMLKIGNESDHFYGATFSYIYTIDFEKKEKDES